MDSVTIDLNRAERATSFLTNNEQERYKPKTLPDRNNGRYAYLPIFPTKSAGVNEYLLLANIPVTHLAPNEIACNPNYWCFVPLHCDEALSENAAYFQKNPIGDPELVYRTEMTSAANQRVDHYLQHVPLEPNGYVFSYRQLQKQRLFFQHFVCSATHHLPYHAIDLYKMAIIAVLPDDRSILLRYLIETLFIIHGETKLNMICPIGSDVMQRYGHPYHLVWCANLNRLPMVTSTFIE
ncbi:unnamed protein product [Rotaria sp. Silwood1]|nr:unnamed protein product [Rotaria sp. Silwood1]